jgi:tetratricopeptide (TPR) repeat protein
MKNFRLQHITFSFFLGVALSLNTQEAQAGFSLFDRRAAITDSYVAEAKLQYDKAIEAIMPLYQIDTQSYFLNIRLGWLFYLKGPLKNAESHYQKAIEIKPSSVEARAGLYKVYLAKGQLDQAVDPARQLLKVDPQNYTAHLQLAHVLYTQQKFKDALIVVDTIRKNYPIDLGVLEQRVLILFKMPDLRAAAIDAFRELITIYPQSTVVTQGLVQMELEQNVSK